MTFPEPASNSTNLTDPDQSPAAPATLPGRPPDRAPGMLAGWMRDVVISLAVSAFFIVFLYQPVKVEGTSMMPTLADQERVFINKFVYRIEPIERGDVIVFHYPRDVSKSYIKRVVGVPGDRVRIDDGVVFVNGRRLPESYVPEQYEDVRSYPERVVPAALLLCPGRPPQSLQRQPRLRPGGRKLYLR